MQKYRILGKKGEGTFSEVLKVQDVRDGNYFACKKMKQRYESIDQVNNLREIQAMRRLNPHGNVIELKEIIFDKGNGKLALICELMDMNLYEMIRGRRHYLPEARVKQYMYQLCKSIDHMHRNGIFHRDVKPEKQFDNIMKIGDIAIRGSFVQFYYATIFRNPNLSTVCKEHSRTPDNIFPIDARVSADQRQALVAWEPYIN